MSIFVRASHGTHDSYSCSYPKTDVTTIIEAIKSHPYNHYNGGKIDSTMAIIDNYVPGYIFNDCIKIKFFSIENCRAFEEAIKPYVEHFTPRDFGGDLNE